MSLIHFLFWLLTAKLSIQEIITASSNISKPGCLNKCGNLTVPYPFGIGSNCSMNPWFDIYCNTSVDPPYMLVSMRDDYHLINISESQIRIKNLFFASRCENSSSNFTLDFSETPYTLSDTNKLTHVGCSDLALFGVRSGQNAAPNLTLNNFASGCVAFCSNGNQSHGRSCPGNGCCQIPIPKGTVFVNASISGVGDRWGSVETKPCSYSFIWEKDSVAFDAISDLYKQSMSIVDWLGSSEVVLDWRIGTDNCSQARNSGGFGCHGNSVCIDADGGGGGYRCGCLQGYQGNPYLPPGCLDIDECKDNPCHSTAICINNPGDYTCKCPPGYSGDGWRNSTGCLRVKARPTYGAAFLGELPIIMGSIILTSISFTLRKFMKKREQKSNKRKFFKQNGGLLLQQQISVQEGHAILGNIQIFTTKDLEKATDQFNESRILGRGGQGTVYKGMLANGKIVAIKKCQLVDENKSNHLIQQFINEVVILSQINHRNVVKLLGCCLETEVPLLVYEFVPNGTLFDHIHDDNNGHEFPFSWKIRLKIAVDVAGALAYLHSASSLPIVHRDIKSSNILLDEKYVAKVSDFGISKSLEVDQTHLTTLVKGTFGYIDPEYFQSNQFTEKSDVFSFGVVLVELLTGLEPIIPTSREEDERSLVRRFMDADNLDSILDDQIVAEGEKNCVVAVAKLARRCLNLNGRERPNMKEVATELENVRMAMMGSNVHARLQEDSNTFSEDNYAYSWTSPIDIGTTSSSDVHPIMFDTI